MECNCFMWKTGTSSSCQDNNRNSTLTAWQTSQGNFGQAPANVLTGMKQHLTPKKLGLIGTKTKAP